MPLRPALVSVAGGVLKFVILLSTGDVGADATELEIPGSNLVELSGSVSADRWTEG